jgi:hypothetical protein
MNSLCYSCEYAIYEGGDYCPGFDGCCTPEYVCECKNEIVQKSLKYEDLDFDEVKECSHYKRVEKE